MEPARARNSKSPIRDVWTLFDTSKVGQTSLDDYLKLVLDRCADWLRASGASIFLLDEESGTFRLAAKSGHESSAPDDATIIPGEGIAGSAIQSKKPILIDDPRNHPALRLTELKRNRKWGSSLVVPLLTPDHDCIGVLNLSRTRDEARFSDENLRSAKSLGGHIALAVANGRLLSRLRLAVEEATQTHERLDTILSSIAIGIVVLSPKGAVTHINPEATALIGGATLQAQPFEAYVQLLPNWLQEPIRQVCEIGSSGERGSAVARDDIGGVAYSLTASPLFGGGVTIAIQDTTEHESVIREMSRVRRLAEIGQMTAAIAHEIRNPLWAMRAAAQVIQTDESVAIEFGKIIEDEVVKLSELCSGFLDFARPLELSLQWSQVGAIVETIADQHRPLFVERGVALLVAVSASQPPIQCDPLRIEQIVRNLLLNALEASCPGGQVAVSCVGGNIVVQDSGSGMEHSSLEKLFTPFFTTKPGGSGLGLSTVRKIVDAHGGSIEVESEPGKGTCFTVRLGRMAA